MRAWIKIVLGLGLGLLIALLVFPFLYRDKFTQYIKKEINNRIHGKLEFSSADISLIKNFPNISLSLHEVDITGQNPFNNTVLFKSKTVTLGFDLKRLIVSRFKEYQLTKLDLEEPEANLITSKTGIFNLTDLLNQKPSSPTSNTGLDLYLDKIKISKGRLQYIDSSSQFYLGISGLTHLSQGNYKGNSLSLNHTTSFDSLNYITGGSALLKNVSGSWSGPLNINLDLKSYTFGANQIALNAFNLRLQGSVSQKPDLSFAINLVLNTPDNDLKQFISLIPGGYKAHFKELKATGAFSGEGSIVGDYNSKTGAFPIIQFSSAIDNGVVKYNHLPYPIQNIQLKLAFQSLDSLGSHFKVDIPIYSLEVEHEAIKGNLTIIQVKTGTTIKGESKGDITLETLSKALPVDSLLMAGNLKFDTHFDFAMNDISNKAYEKIKMDGMIKADQLKVKYLSYLPIDIPHGTATLNPRSTLLDLQNAHYGRSDIQGRISISNPLAFFTKDISQASIDMDIKSHVLDINEILKQNESKPTSPGSFQDESMVPHLNLFIHTTVDGLMYKDYDISQAKMDGTLKNDTMKIKNLDLNLNQSRLAINGTLEKLYQWSNSNAMLSGFLNIRSSDFNLNPWMNDSSKISAKSIDDSLFVKNLPERTDLKLNVSLGQVAYIAFQFKNVTGDINLVNQNLEVYNSSGKLFNGNVSFNGIYNETNALPAYNFKLDLSDLKIEDMFKSSRTLSVLVPIAAFLEGKFSSSMVMNGKLNASLEPMLNEFDAAGILETINGAISKFKPIEDILSKIQIPIFNKINWAKSKNYFEINKGVMTIKPFEIKTGDVIIQLSGTHHLDQDMNYNAVIGIPRKVFDKYKIGIAMNNQLDWLRTEVSKKGINLNALDTIYLLANVSGSIKNPITKVSWVQKPNGKSIQDQIKDELKNQLKSKADSIQREETGKLNQKKDSILNILKEEVNLKKEQLDSLTHKVEDSLKKTVQKKSQEALDSIKSKAGKTLDSSVQAKLDTLVGNKAKDEIKKINDKLKDWNPFKKKPKSN
jgi:hypothetical protein